MRRLISIAVLSLLFWFAAAPVAADGIIIPIPVPPHPAPPLRALAIKYHRVTVTIDNQVATTHVDQVFVNESNTDLEGEYLFPIPEGATVSRFAMWVDGQPLEAQVLSADEARRIYEEIVAQRRDPALLEYTERGAYRARIYPIPARGETRVELEYSEVLPLDAGLVRYVYPLNTERFSTRPLQDVSVTVRLVSRDPLLSLYSPSHPIETSRTSDGATVRYHDEDVRPDKDFVLYYQVSDDALAANLLSYKEAGEDGFFLLLLAPRADLQAREVVARDVFFVLDTSGSMRGDKLAQAKAAARYVLTHLQPADRFNVISFGSSTRLYARDLRPASEAEDAARWVGELAAGGGTNILRALSETLAQARSDRPQVVLFLTDGLATEGEVDTIGILEGVRSQAPEGLRLFTFGVGYEINTALLDSLAQEQHGAGSYVRPEEDIEHAVSALYDKISSPVLVDLALDFGAVQVEDAYPYPLPDLFAGGQLVVVGRYRSGGATSITLSGAVNGERQQLRFPGVQFAETGGPDFIPRLWATRKIGHLLTQIRLYGPEQELVDEVVALSVRYGIVTPYTSFLIDETEDALSEEGRQSIAERVYQEAPAAGAALDGRGTGAPTAAVSGEAAVTKSEAHDALREAEVPAEQATEQVRYVGAKTFVLRDRVWTDTTWDPTKLQPEPVPFAGERYYQLVRANPSWGRYLALGPEVILVQDDHAYQIVPNDARTAPPHEAQSTPAPAYTTATPEPRGDRSLWEWLHGLLSGLW
ncbi:MAG: VWA domain-containing protein [Chloroflexi bacterium]|nr:VWA domain-containing protein [Chloroflexota bacterium]